MKKINPGKACVLLAFLLLLVFWVHEAGKKEDMHCDEYFSYMGANSNFAEEGFAFENLENGEWVTPEYFVEKLSVGKNEIFDYKSAWNNQKSDVHPPLYYLLLHAVTSLRAGRFSMMAGLTLNMALMLGTLFLLYKILVIFTGNKLMSAIAVLAFGTCPGVISTIVFIRMYALMTFLAILYIYLYVAFEYGKIDSKVFFTGIFLINILGGLTQYYFLIFCFGIFVAYVVWNLILIVEKKRKPVFLAFYALTNVLSAGVYLLLWPSCIEHIFHGYRGEETFENISELNNFLKNITKMFVHLNQGIFLNSGKILLILASLIAAGMYLKKQWNKGMALALAVGCNALFYYVLVAHISELKADRYLMPIYPIIALVVFTFLVGFLKCFEQRGVNVFVIFMCVFAIANVLHEPNYLYDTREAQVEDIIGVQQDNCLYVHHDYHWYQLAYNLAYFTKFQNTKIVYDMDDLEVISEDLELQELSSLTVYFDSDYNDEDMLAYFGNNLWSGQYVYDQIGESDYCNIYLFEKNE